MAPRFASIEIPCPITETDLSPGTICPVCEECAPAPECPSLPLEPTQPDQPGEPSQPVEEIIEEIVTEYIFRIYLIERSKGETSIFGTGLPNSTLTILIY